MTKGFASNLLINGDKKIINGVVFTEDDILKDIKILNREYPFTSFFDGAILICREGVKPFEEDQEVNTGEKITIWHIPNYNRHAAENKAYDDFIIKKVSG